MPAGYLRACLLLLVAEAPVHGYELMGRIDQLGLCRPDPGSLYRTLRALEDEGLVRSWWEPAEAGPARRVYRTTDDGRGCLECVTAALARSHRHLSAYLERHRSLSVAADAG